MGNASESPFARPFSGLADLLGKDRKHLPVHSGKPAPRGIRASGRKSHGAAEKGNTPGVPGSGDRLATPVSPDPADEYRLFQAEMADVTPLVRDRIPPKEPSSRPGSMTDADGKHPQALDPAEDRETLRRLTALVETGSGFIVRHTPEYMEGRHPEAPAAVIDRLHRGDFSVQNHLDLHGMTRREAAPALDAFLCHAVERGFRTVLLVHGRGLSSPREPVLKQYVRQRLMSRRWRGQVLAFASARLCDGGAGAVYVLLRERRGSGKTAQPPPPPFAAGNLLESG